MVSVKEGVHVLLTSYFTCMDKILEITRRDGAVMRIAQSCFEPAERPTVFTVEVVADGGTVWRLVDDCGLEASIPKEIVDVNHLKVVAGRLTLSEALYRHWFRGALKRRHRELPLLSNEHLDWMLRHPALVLDNPAYFLLKWPGMLCGDGLFLRAYECCLGGVLEAWLTFGELAFEWKGETVFLLRVIGSPLSGTNTFFAFSPSRKTIFHGVGIPHWFRHYKTFQTIAQRYPFSLKDNDQLTYKLMGELANG